MVEYLHSADGIPCVQSSQSKAFTKDATADEVAPALQAINDALAKATGQLKQPLNGELSYGEKVAAANSVAGVITSVVTDLSKVDKKVLEDPKVVSTTLGSWIVFCLLLLRLLI